MDFIAVKCLFWDILFSRWSRWRANSVIIGTKILVLYGV
jgi:hypothetical protein